MLFQKQLEIPGFNACIWPTEDGYIGLSRTCRHRSDENNFPEVYNRLLWFRLNNDFDMIEQSFLEDVSGRIVHTSWTTGFEDPRFITPSTALVVTCDTSPHWIPEISLIHLNSETKQVTAVHPLRTNSDHGPQKNWLFLKNHSDTQTEYLYSSFPFRVISVDKETGTGTIVKTTGVSDRVAHNGALVVFANGYLLTVRIREGNGYKHSLWVFLNAEYEPVAISDPFIFVAPTYEMCMSLHVEGDILVACVSVGDTTVYVQKYNVNDILKSLKAV